MIRAPRALAVGAAILAAACAREAIREYPLQGQIVAVRPDTAELTVKHGDIEGLMPGMVMTFPVADRADLEGRTPGELIEATLVVTGSGSRLAHVRVVGRAPLDPGTAAAAAPLLAPGDPAPDAAFVTETGEPFRLAGWRGSLVLITFIYTRCPLPDFCPRMERHFLEIQQAIEADPRLRGRAKLAAVSFDPAHDTPAVLRRRAADIGAQPGTWRYLTGEAGEIERFAAAFGVAVIRNPGEAGDITHNLRTVLVGADGRILEVWSGGDWTPAEVVSRLRQELAGA